MILGYYREHNKMAKDIAMKLNEKFDEVNPEKITQEEFSKELKEATKIYADERKTATSDLPDVPKSAETDIRREV